MKKKGILIIALSIHMFSGQLFALEKNLLQLIQSRYKSILSFSGKFVQNSYRIDLEMVPKKAEGIVSYKRPGKMRWHYSYPEEQLIVTNGEILWLFDPLLENVTVQKLEKIADGTALSFLLGLGDLNYDFEQRSVSESFSDLQDNLVVELIPKKDTANLSFIQLQVKTETYDLIRILLMDHQGNYRTIFLDSMKYNLEIENKLFEFQITEDIDVIEIGD